MVAEFESDLIRMRTREGMPVNTNAELAELFSIGRSTVYRALERAQARTTA